MDRHEIRLRPGGRFRRGVQAGETIAVRVTGPMTVEIRPATGCGNRYVVVARNTAVDGSPATTQE